MSVYNNRTKMSGSAQYNRSKMSGRCRTFLTPHEEEPFLKEEPFLCVNKKKKPLL